MAVTVDVECRGSIEHTDRNAGEREADMHDIVVLLELDDKEQAAFKAAAGDNKITFHNEKKEFVSSLGPEYFRDADIILGQPRPSALKEAVNLKWLQTRSSGVDKYTAPGVLREGVVLTSGTGAYGTAVAEHAFGMMLGAMKTFPQYRDNQHASLWRPEDEVKSPEGLDILILGTGDLGSAFGRFCKAFGAHTIGVRRDKSKPAEGIDEMHGMDEIDELVAKADVICSMLPHSDEMVGYFDYSRFMTMKKDAIFINVGRGPIVDADGLYRALEEGQLFGAALDTLDPEPFPKEHPLWRQQRVFITPHTAGGDHLESTVRKVNAIALENLRAYLEGRPLKNRKL